MKMKYSIFSKGIKNSLLIIISLLFVCSSNLFAGDYEKHELSIVGQGGFLTFYPEMNAGGFDYQFGGGVGINYHFFFSDVFAIGTGVDISLHQFDMKMDPYSNSYTAHDGTETFDFNYTIHNHKERLSTFFLNIPLMFQWQYPLFHDDHYTYFSIGGKVGIPLKSTHKMYSSNFTTSGYYPQYELLVEEPKDLGFGTFARNEQEQDIDLNIAYVASAEAGMKWSLGYYLSLYTGIYFEYGLNDIKKESTDKALLLYNASNPSDYKLNSMWESKYIDNAGGKTIVQKVRPASLGIKVRFTFKLPRY